MSLDIGYVVAQNDTLALRPVDRPQFWREHVRLNHGGLDFGFDEAVGFRGATVVQRSGDYQLVEFWSDPIAYVRSERSARADDDRSIRVLVPRSGEFRVTGSTGRLSVSPGTAVAVSMSAAFSIAHGAGGRAWVFSVPESAWPRSLVPTDPHLIDLGAGLGAVALAMAAQVSTQRWALTEADFLDAATSISMLLTRCLGVEADGTLSSLARAAHELVRLESDDPTLTPSTLAGRLGWSLRQVQAALEEAGTTPSELIRVQRLTRARSRLADRDRRDRGIAEIAHASGFGSLSTFNAVFREAFGMTPRQARWAGAPRSPRTGTSGIAMSGNTATAANAKP